MVNYFDRKNNLMVNNNIYGDCRVMTIRSGSINESLLQFFLFHILDKQVGAEY